MDTENTNENDEIEDIEVEEEHQEIDYEDDDPGYVRASLYFEKRQELIKDVNSIHMIMNPRGWFFVQFFFLPMFCLRVMAIQGKTDWIINDSYGSYQDSIASYAFSIDECLYENGRRYHKYFGTDRNLHPIDEVYPLHFIPFIIPPGLGFPGLYFSELQS
jgi:hypothetical protein